MTVAGPNGAGARTCRSNSNAMASGAPHSPALTEAVITFLEMREPPALPELRAPLGKLALMRVEHPSLAFYKFLYDEVGQGYHWTERKVLSDRDLKVIIEDDQVEINVLYVGGVPAGFSELDRRQPPEIELCYFGIMPQFIGHRLGGYFLNWTIRHAWACHPSRLWVHTNTLDHPRALPLYQRLGFAPYARRTVYLDPDPNPPRDPD